MFGKQNRSEADLGLLGGWVDWAFKGLLRTQVLELLSCSETEGRSTKRPRFCCQICRQDPLKYYYLIAVFWTLHLSLTTIHCSLEFQIGSD